MKKFSLIIVCLFFITISAGCGESENIAVNPENPENDKFHVTVVDGLGRQVKLSRNPGRIISLAPGNTELLFALGLGEKVVGVSEYCNYPAEALDKPKAGDYSEPNVEQILALQPDLVVADPFQDEQLSVLEELGVPSIVLDPSSLEEIYASIMMLGKATGEEKKAQELENELRKKIEGVREKVSHLPEGEKVKVYYEVYPDPLMSIGSNTIIHELIETAGGINIFADLAVSYPQISAEAVIEGNPDVIIFPDYHGTEGFLLGEIINRPGWGSITAVKNNCVFGVDPDKISRPGPRITEAAEELTGLFYPDR